MYKSIDGLRAYSALAIIMVHVYANLQYNFNSIIFNNAITNSLIFLFMMISGFGMCCGYYEKVKNKEISPNEFYTKRYKKALPFFAVLVVLDIIISRNFNSVFEGFADLTLAFSLLPNPNIQVIGVGWTLGVIFVFYMLFPFFVYLLDNRKRAWFVLIISLIFNLICVNYFFQGNFVVDGYDKRRNIIYCSIFFIIGGIIYLYKNEIIKFVSCNRYKTMIFCIFITLIFALIFNYEIFSGDKTIKISLLFAIWLMYAIGSNGKILNNKFTNFLSKISMEIYLSHMVIFRILEKLKITTLINNEIVSYILVCILTIIGSIIFSIAIKKLLNCFEKNMQRVVKKECHN